MSEVNLKDIKEEVKKLKKELFSLRIKKSVGEEIKTTDIRVLKKKVARALTKLNANSNA